MDSLSRCSCQWDTYELCSKCNGIEISVFITSELLQLKPQPEAAQQHRISRSIPHGGHLVDKMLYDDASKNVEMASCTLEVELDERQLCDVELLMQGGFSPLEGYMDEEDYLSVVNNMHLANGLIFGLPVVYDTDDENLKVGDKLLLKHQHIPIATLEITSKYIPNKAQEALKCYGTTSLEHPAVSMISTERGKYYCGMYLCPRYCCNITLTFFVAPS